MLPVTSRTEDAEFCLRRDFSHPLIDVRLLTTLTGVEGEAGDFTVHLETRPRFVSEDACIACGKCEEVCPETVPDPFNGDLSDRKAIYVRKPQGIPNTFVIDEAACSKCGKCVDVCPTNAISLDAAPEAWQLKAASVVVAAGFDLFDPNILLQYGWGRYPDVLTSLQLERLLSETGPTLGSWKRQATGEPVKKAAFIQCVGSRDRDHPYCSSACCMIALKEAAFMKEKDPEIDIAIYYMDMRDFGKGYHRYREEVVSQGVRLVPSRVPDVKYNPKDKRLRIHYLDAGGQVVEDEVDQVILSVGQMPSDKSGKLAALLGLKKDEGGYLKANSLNVTTTEKEGILLCGSVREPRDIPDAICEGDAAAAQAIQWVDAPLDIHEEKASLSDVALEPPKVGVFLCRCAGEISSRLELPAIAKSLQDNTAVAFVEEVDTLCLKNTAPALIKRIQASKVNRVVFGACVPYRFERQFRDIIREAGLPENFMAIANIREQVAWVHEPKTDAAQNKARALVAAAIDRVAGEIPKTHVSQAVAGRVLVLGGGVAGLTAARFLANQGVAVDLVEQSEVLGGNFRNTYFLLGGGNPQEFLNTLIHNVEASETIHVLTGSRAVSKAGDLGRFVVGLETPSGPLEEVYGGVILATGAREHEVTEYGYGQHPGIVTMKEFGEKLADPAMTAPKSLVMIQCVGSREDGHPYCSRFCCSKALAHALEVKQRWPECRVSVLFRDIMTYGSRERAYTEAREMGVHFFRYSPEEKPLVKTGGETPDVLFTDPVLGGEVSLSPDYVILSNGVVPDDRGEVADMFSIETTEDGFLKEAEIKFRPVDTLEPGIWACGLALGPKNVDEVVVQAEAAAARTLAILRKERLQLPHVRAWVSPRRCSACEICVPACPYSARVKDPDLGYVVVREALCQGCGVCTTVCPNNAVKLISYQENQLFSMIDRMVML